MTILNDDRFVHHVHSDSMKIDSGVQRPGESVDVKFDKSGTYELLCAIHPKMRLSVTVE